MRRLVVTLIAVLLAYACTRVVDLTPGEAPPDGGIVDSQLVIDAPPIFLNDAVEDLGDGGIPPLDASTLDASARDASLDASTLDASARDASLDAFALDASALDSGLPDGGSPDGSLL